MDFIEKEKLRIEEEQKKMEGVLGKPRSQGDLDEAPGSYKDVEWVMEQQKDLVKILVDVENENIHCSSIIFGSGIGI